MENYEYGYLYVFVVHTSSATGLDRHRGHIVLTDSGAALFDIDSLPTASSTVSVMNHLGAEGWVIDEGVVGNSASEAWMHEAIREAEPKVTSSALIEHHLMRRRRPEQ